MIGGAERRVQEVCARWRSDGHTVIVIEGPSGPSLSMDAQWEYQSISLPIWHGGTFHALRLTRRFWMEAVRIGKLYSGRVDVVVSATSCLSDVITSRTIAKDLKVPWALVVVIHAYGSSFLATLKFTIF